MGGGDGEEDRGWGEHGRKVEGVGVDVEEEEEPGDESFCLFVTENNLVWSIGGIFARL